MNFSQKNKSDRKEHKYKVGDYVQHDINKYRMKITKLLGYNDKINEPLYEAVDDNGEVHTIVEMMLEPCTEQQHVESQNMNTSIIQENETSIIDNGVHESEETRNAKLREKIEGYIDNKKRDDGEEYQYDVEKIFNIIKDLDEGISIQEIFEKYEFEFDPNSIYTIVAPVTFISSRGREFVKEARKEQEKRNKLKKKTKTFSENENDAEKEINTETGNDTSYKTDELENYRLNGDIEEKEASKAEQENQIQLKTNEVLRFLNITNSDNSMIQLKNAMRIHKYIAQNSTYTSNIMQEKTGYTEETAYLNELYNGLINHKGVCTTDSIVFKHLLSQIGMHGDVVILQSKEGGEHAATLVQLGNESYYFDTTLERTTFEHFSNNPEEFKICCAALGQEEYGQFYTPV